MRVEDFYILYDETQEAMYGSLIERGELHTQDDDRLHDLMLAGALTGQSPEKALMGMDTPSLVFIDNVIRGNVIPTREQVEKFMNRHLCYMVLLKALMVERIEFREGEAAYNIEEAKKDRRRRGGRKGKGRKGKGRKRRA